MGDRKFRIEVDDAPITGRRLVQLFLVPQHVTQIVVRFRIGRVDLHRPPVADDRLIQFFPVSQFHAQVVVRFGIIGIDFHGPPWRSGSISRARR